MNTHERQSPGRSAGFSLIELLISLAVGLVLLLGMGTLMVQQSSTRADLERSGRQIENGRYALSILQEDIQNAGYYGRATVPATAPLALPNPCETGLTAASIANIKVDMAMPVQVYDAPASVPAPLSGCLSSANVVPGTDILVIRRAQVDETLDTLATATATANRVYVQTNASAVVAGISGSTAATTFTLVNKDGTTAPLRKYVVRIYFVSPCDVPSAGTACTGADDGGTPIPTLKRLELVDGAFTVTPLVEGIQDLQFELGIDRDLDGAPDIDAAYSYTRSPVSLSDAVNVVAVNVNLLARNTEPTFGWTDTKTYTLGRLADTVAVGPFGGSDPASGGYKRHAYSAAVRVVNLSASRL